MSIKNYSKNDDIDNLLELVNECEKNKKKIDESINSLKKNNQEVDNLDLDMDWSSIYDDDLDVIDTHVDSCSDGLIFSLKNKGCVDIEYISKITNLDLKTVIKKLKGSIYQDPNLWNECYYKGFVTANEYLSGNLLKRYKEARSANQKYHGYFQNNVDAIVAVMPKTIDYKDIYYKLSSPWIPHELIKRFFVYMFNLQGYYSSDKFLEEVIKHDVVTGTWEVKLDNYYSQNVSANLKYGTYRVSAKKLLERLLNGKSTALYDSITDADGKKKSILNKADTIQLEQKAKELEEEFRNFIESDNINIAILRNAYNDMFGSFLPRIYDGSFLEFPNMSSDINLFPYQKDAVARIIFNSNTLLAHNVGTGKTFIMVASGEEMLRMNLSKKNLYVVPNNLVGQWESIYKKIYPKRDLLVLSPNDFSKDNRNKTLLKMKKDDSKVIIIPSSSFDTIELSKSIRIGLLHKRLAEIDKEILTNNSYTYSLVRLRDTLEKELEKLNMTSSGLEVTFDELGFTRLYIDEAHYYKNVPIVTNIGFVRGINTEGSKKCRHMMDICEYMNSNINNGIIMATGTPITNSITDAYIFQKYLQNGELKLLNIDTFDKWVSMFAERFDELEVDVDTSNYRVVTRFSKFHNLLQLTSIFSSIADFYYNINDKDLPKFNGYTNITIPKNEDLRVYIKYLSNRVDLIRNGTVSRKDDNMLKVTTDGRKAALDLRLVDDVVYHDYHLGKVKYCAEEVSNIYFKTSKDNLTQLVFCDISTPKNEFNIYDELKNTLVDLGVKESDIAFIHDATTDSKRNKLFDEMNKGKRRILIGSTQKLGLGVNVQDKLYAIHHLDIPWRPADMVQREGRILRQGNMNEEVFIYRYIAEGSFDAYSWQLLETKQKFINELLSNSLNEKTKEDINDTVLSYAEVKSLAIDNPLLKDLITARNELNKYRMLKQRNIERKAKLKTRSLELPSMISELEDSISNIKLDIKRYEEEKIDYSKENRQNITNDIYNGLNNHLGAKDELVIYNYQGFEIVALSHMLDNHLALKINGNGSYYLQLGTSERGIIIRIDNFLDNFPKLLEEKEKELDKLREEEKSIIVELEKDVNYDNEMDTLIDKIRYIEKEMDK